MTTILATAIGGMCAALLLLRQTALWQRKEYRLDRLAAELKESWRMQPMVWLVILLTALLSLRLPAAAWLGLLLLAGYFVYDARQRGIFRPAFTAKAIVILILSAALLGILFITLLSASTPAPLSWLVLSLASIPATTIAVGAGNLVGNLQKRQVIARAKQLRRKLPHLKVIGITGSFGKTSTKYFLHHVLSGGASSVHMSADRRNETFVIAQDMLAQLKPQSAAYIVEMAAYREHEIARLAELAQPTIGVVTAIKNQHLALFGSLEALAAAKWELIEALPATGTAVLNADDAVVVKQAERHRGRVVWYSLKKPADVYASAIKLEPASSTFTLHIKDATDTVTIPLPGPGYVSAAAAAAASAYAAGHAAPDIFARLSTLPAVPQTMSLATNSKGSTILDDSYSANEAGVLMAIEHLARFPQPKKIIVLRPLIELGPDAPRVHASIGQALATANSEIFLFDAPGAADIERAAAAVGLSHPLHRFAAPGPLAQAVSEALDNHTVCLLENRLPDVVRAAALA